MVSGKHRRDDGAGVQTLPSRAAPAASFPSTRLDLLGGLLLPSSAVDGAPGV